MMTAGDCYIEDDSDAAAAVGRRLVRSSGGGGGVADPSANHNPFFGGSFQFIVQEQAKSMVAIQVLLKINKEKSGDESISRRERKNGERYAPMVSFFRHAVKERTKK